MPRTRIDDTIPLVGFKLNVQRVILDQEQFLNLCNDNPDTKFELTARKELVIVPPANPETGHQNASLIGQLYNWTKKNRRGRSFDSNTFFKLANGAIRSPDTAWISNKRYETLTIEQRTGIPPICPEFIAELRSPNDRLHVLKAKMEEYIENGAKLGWLIDPSRRRIYIYRPGDPVEQLDNPEYVDGSPVLPGFKFRTREIF